MMKRKFLAVVLPIIGCATVVGSGFSAWYFGEYVENGTNGSFTIGINVTEEVEASKGNLIINSNATNIDDATTIDEVVYGARLVLDQGGARNNNDDSGIMFGDESSTATKETDGKVWAFTVSYDDTAGGTGINEIYDAGLRIRINLSIELKGNLKDYITFQNPVPTVSVSPSGLTGTDDPVTLTGEGTTRSGEYIITDEQVNRSETTASWTFGLGVDTKKKENGDYSNALLKYLPHQHDHTGVYNGGKPNHEGEPEIMEGKLNDASIEFKVTAFIEDDPTR